MENVIIMALRVLMWIAFIVAPIGGFLAGGNAGGQMGEQPGAFNLYMAVGGAVSGFIFMVFTFGVIAILLKIEANTRRQ